VAHISFADPVCPELSEVVAAAGRAAASTSRKGGTYLCMEGPAFSTKAESNVYRSWGMDVIGHDNLQEAKLAPEAEIWLRDGGHGDGTTIAGIRTTTP